MLFLVSFRLNWFCYDGVAFSAFPLLRPFTKASVASRSERAQQRNQCGLIPFILLISSLNISAIFKCFYSVFLIFLLRQESETAAPAQGAAVVRASSFNPWTVYNQSAAQLEPRVPSAQNSNRCRSAGFGRQLAFVRMS